MSVFVLDIGDRLSLLSGMAEQKIKSHREIIDCWPSVDDLAADLEVKTDRVRKWKTRDSIPSTSWSDVVTAAQSRGYPVTLELLSSIAGKRAA